LTEPTIQADAKRLASCCRELEQAQAKVEQLYKRWEELVKKRDSL
jgi:exonuclease VII small subunit